MESNQTDLTTKEEEKISLTITQATVKKIAQQFKLCGAYINLLPLDKSVSQSSLKAEVFKNTKTGREEILKLNKDNPLIKILSLNQKQITDIKAAALLNHQPFYLHLMNSIFPYNTHRLPALYELINEVIKLKPHSSLSSEEQILYSIAIISESLSILVNNNIDPIILLMDPIAPYYIDTLAIRELVQGISQNPDLIKDLEERGATGLQLELLKADEEKIIKLLNTEFGPSNNIFLILEESIKYSYNNVALHIIQSIYDNLDPYIALENSPFNDFYLKLVVSFTNAITRDNIELCSTFLQLWNIFLLPDQARFINLFIQRMSEDNYHNLILNLIKETSISDSMVKFCSFVFAAENLSKQQAIKLTKALKVEYHDILKDMFEDLSDKIENIKDDSPSFTELYAYYHLVGIAKVTEFMSLSIKTNFIEDNFDMVSRVTKYVNEQIKAFVTLTPSFVINPMVLDLLAQVQGEELIRQDAIESLSKSAEIVEASNKPNSKSSKKKKKSSNKSTKIDTATQELDNTKKLVTATSNIDKDPSQVSLESSSNTPGDDPDPDNNSQKIASNLKNSRSEELSSQIATEEVASSIENLVALDEMPLQEITLTFGNFEPALTSTVLMDTFSAANLLKPKELESESQELFNISPETPITFGNFNPALTISPKDTEDTTSPEQVNAPAVSLEEESTLDIKTTSPEHIEAATAPEQVNIQAPAFEFTLPMFPYTTLLNTIKYKSCFYYNKITNNPLFSLIVDTGDRLYNYYINPQNGKFTQLSSREFAELEQSPHSTANTKYLFNPYSGLYTIGIYDSQNMLQFGYSIAARSGQYLEPQNIVTTTQNTQEASNAQPSKQKNKQATKKQQSSKGQSKLDNNSKEPIKIDLKAQKLKTTDISIKTSLAIDSKVETKDEERDEYKKSKEEIKNNLKNANKLQVGANNTWAKIDIDYYTGSQEYAAKVLGDIEETFIFKGLFGESQSA